jgi:hypothetical protein
MADGTVKSIENVKIGDEIISGNGKICKVRETNKRQVKNEKAVRFEVHNIQHSFKVTANQKFYVVKC